MQGGKQEDMGKKRYLEDVFRKSGLPNHMLVGGIKSGIFEMKTVPKHCFPVFFIKKDIDKSYCQFLLRPNNANSQYNEPRKGMEKVISRVCYMEKQTKKHFVKIIANLV